MIFSLYIVEIYSSEKSRQKSTKTKKRAKLNFYEKSKINKVLIVMIIIIINKKNIINDN